ncbi:class B sortase [Holdemania sp. Marseille-P2844]|uniref:class B sortase n=1 Tax=Holdemania sp. Marseille-P2844 TaxID=1852366 RepID=UPI0009347417|nr:class B sortase [Holdemania sp. Marseille-P2844]
MVKKILPFLTLFFAAVMVVAIIMIIGEVKDRQQEIDDFNELADLIADVTVPDKSEDITEPENSETASVEEAEVIEVTEPQEPAPVFTRNLTPLFEKNADCIGWVYIEDTAVDYPVMHTPSEPQRYLRLNFDKEYSNAGIPFLDGDNTLDCDNLIIYGHNMRNGTMFSDVTQYRNEDYFTEHPVIEFETARGLKLYTVFAVVYVKNNDGWYDFHTAADETDYNNKIAEIKRRALYDTSITPEYGQQLLTLSTCYGATKSDRIIVIGVESNP